jgi:hypothetical protein
MIASIPHFEESTAFELYVLETMVAGSEKHDGATLEFRGCATIIGVSMHESVSAEALEQQKRKLMPLLFGAAWKILDLLLELALNRAGLARGSTEWRIADKQRLASQGAGDRMVLGCSEAVWQALCRVYVATVEHRHCLVHREAKVDAVSGTLEGVDRQQRPLVPLTREHQLALSSIAGLAARAVLAGVLDPRTEDHLKYQLDVLRSHTGMTAFGVARASVPAQILLTLVQEHGTFVLDMTGVLGRAKTKLPDVAHFDVVIDIPGDSGRRLFARAENCPPGKSMIDVNALPPWLEYR